VSSSRALHQRLTRVSLQQLADVLVERLFALKQKKIKKLKT
jgi:hypothetical protein